MGVPFLASVALSGSEESVVTVGSLVGDVSEVLPCVVPGGSGRMCWELTLGMEMGWGGGGAEGHKGERKAGCTTKTCLVPREWG